MSMPSILVDDLTTIGPTRSDVPRTLGPPPRASDRAADLTTGAAATSPGEASADRVLHRSSSESAGGPGSDPALPLEATTDRAARAAAADGVRLGRLLRAGVLLLLGAGAHVWLDRSHTPDRSPGLASAPLGAPTQLAAPSAPAALRYADLRRVAVPASRPAGSSAPPTPRFARAAEVDRNAASEPHPLPAAGDDRPERFDGRTPGGIP
jgi:hypothetical protein